MAKKKPSPAPANGSEHLERLIESLVMTGMSQGTTGRFIIVYRRGEAKAGVKQMKDELGLETVSTADFTTGAIPPTDAEGKHVLLENLNIGISNAHPDELESLSLSSGDSPIQFVIPERIYFLDNDPAFPLGMPLPGMPPLGMMPPMAFPPTFAAGGLSADYLRGYRDGVARLIESLVQPTAALQASSAFAPPQASSIFTLPQPSLEGVPGAAFAPTQALGASAFADTEVTWGLQACNVIGSEFSGAGVRVAVLDTGMDLNHEDFGDGRIKASRSFVSDTVQDVPTPRDPFGRWPGNPGHGTHCIGTACGPETSEGGVRYGIAYGADIYVGKVFTNQGTTVDGALLQAIEWALQNECQVISLSLGGPPNGAMPDFLYESVAKRAIRNGTAIIAAAGNRSNRGGGIIKPVDSPANATSIMAVGAVDQAMRVGNFSNRGLFPPAGAVNVVAPGVGVRSSLPGSKYGDLSGTSMATPHVAGIAALLFEARPNFEAWQVMNALAKMARKLPGLDSRDIGDGLVQAP
jgi:subtilisin family serine protease